jgi:hypothetical protein
VNCITGAEGECSTSNNGGGNSAPQIAQFFLAEFGPGVALFGHQVQYECFTGTFNVSDGGNCCLLETGTPPNPIYAGNATYDFIPWTDTLLCGGPITIDLSFYPVLFQPPTYPGYVWSDGTTGPVITITEPGTYSFIVGDYCHYEDGNWLTDTVVVPCRGQLCGYDQRWAGLRHHAHLHAGRPDTRVRAASRQHGSVHWCIDYVDRQRARRHREHQSRLGSARCRQFRYTNTHRYCAGERYGH